MTEPTTIPLNRLSLWSGNVRRTGIHDGIDELAASIAAHGLLQSLVVRKGKLSPVILDAYRRAEIGLDEAQAFAVTDDHDAQERVLSELPDWNRQPHTIRRLLTAQDVSTDDKRVRCIGVDRYVAAGGTIRQDLFCEDGTGYINDVALLDSLVADKLKTAAAEVSSEGWLWVEAVTNADHQALSQFTRMYPEHVDLSDEDKAALDVLSEEYDSLVDDDDADHDRLAELEEKIDALQATAVIWSPDTLAISGAIVTLGYNGEVRIERGLVRKQDLPKGHAAPPSTSQEVDTGNTVRLSDRIIEDLTAEKSAAIGAALMERPQAALASVVHALALDLLYPGHSGDTCLRLRVMPPALRSAIAKPDASKGLAALMAEKDRLGDHLPGNPRDLWAWCLARSVDELLSLLAFIAGSAIDVVRRKSDRPNASRIVHGNQLGEALALDMTEWYVPTVEGYFARVSRPLILAAIDEVKGGHGPALDKLKKSELAVRAEQLLAGTGWLPEPLRIDASASTPDADQAE